MTNSPISSPAPAGKPEPDIQQVRLPAEWEPQRAVIIAWPHALTDWQPRLDQVRECYKEMVAAILPHVPELVIITAEPYAVAKQIDSCADLSKVRFVNFLTNDTWTRDYAPITTIVKTPDISLPTLCDFQFNGWGMKFASCRDNQAASRIYTDDIFPGYDYSNNLDFVLEGGSIESDGHGLLLTTSRCLLSVNRNDTLSPTDIENRLRTSLGARKVLWLDYGFLEGDDTDSHVDTLARLIAPDAIAYTSCDRENDNHYQELNLMARQLANMRTIAGQPFKLFPLPIPEGIYDENGERLPATYANFLILNRSVILPVYGDDHYDSVAVEQMRSAMPGYTIETVDCRELIRQHGSLHCATMQVPEI